ncbi:MAG: ABC-2 family transporter protein [Clostridium sp.]|uniref:ABC transporter permease n=1 Tax=Clostridium sp. TaxID=1506 RepID=UPI0025B9735F|nr:ABC-2 family transporter protein [Clostridium sp.]MCF0149616.1 ABC-2 family transporter protein [Clostridium sp.]
MFKYIKLYSKFLKQYIKTLMEYRMDFILGLIGFILVQLAGVIFIKLIFNVIPTLEGWSFYQILFIYGFAQIPRGIDHIFTDYLWIFSWKTIVNGEFDKYLLRPINPLFQVISESFQPDGLGEVIIGGILIVISSINLNVSYNLLKIIGFIFVILCATLIYTSIKLATSSIAFWVKFSQSHMFMAYQISTFAKYPMGIYPSAIKFILIFIIPFAFTGYYPGIYFIGEGNIITGIVLPFIVSLVSITVSYNIWLKGISVYESAGS